MTSDRVGGVPSRTVTRVELEPSISAPYIARRVVAALIDRGPAIKSVDAALLASELVTAVSGGDDPIVLEIRRTTTTARIEVQASFDGGADELTKTILDRLADRWEIGPPPWFELDLVRRPRRADLDEDALWQQVTEDRAARDEIFARYEGFAGAIARRYRRSGEGADLDQVAYMALVAAIDRFDPARGVKFSTFAGKTISGELKKYLRDTAWAMKVPRSLKESVLLVTKERNELTQELGRTPTVEEIAKKVGMTPAEVEEAMGAGQAFGTTSLDAPVGEDPGTTVIDTIGDEDEALVDAEQWWMIEPVLEKLSERDQQVLHMRFFEDMSQSEIAEVIGVSQMQVSRILSSIFERIKSEVDLD
ncbi:MAG TPA: SigB/SigF/SigG family RNA polymerase sigma factor [Acidimicrobiia bacterium]|nr:SigB/SigF/SigG family RNA polymerase sigma factor [Acidimicrobiia bacterium]